MPRGNPRKMLALRLPAELIAAVDKKRGKTPRTAWIEQALREKLGPSAPSA